MSDIHPSQIKQQAGFSSTSTHTAPKGDDLTGTADMLDLGRKNPTKPKSAARKKGVTKSAAKRKALLEQPPQTIEEAIAAGVPPKELDALLKAWSDFNLQQAQLKVKAESAALANAISERRRKIADELLKYADGYGISIAEARNIFAEALEAQRSGKLK